jgi:hypothetical protein
MSPFRAGSLALFGILVLTAGAFEGRRLTVAKPAAGWVQGKSGVALEGTSRATDPPLPGVSATRLAPGAPPGTEPPATAASSTSPGNETMLMARLRRIEDGDPTVALQLAREGNDVDPNGSDSAERAMIVVKSLARQGDLEAARGEAERMVNAYPGTPWALEVERRTGAHPHVRR